MRYGDHPVTKDLLVDILEKQTLDYQRAAIKRGVRDFDAEKVVEQAFLTVLNLEIVDDIAKQLGLSPKSALASVAKPNSRKKKKHMLRDALSALLMNNVKYKCLDYHKARKREEKRVISLETFAAATPPPVLAESSIREVLLTIGPLPGVSLEKVEEGDPAMLSKFVDAIAARAGLTELEHRFVKFRADNPDASDKDFDPTLKAYTIARIKRPAFDKLRRLFGQA